MPKNCYDWHLWKKERLNSKTSISIRTQGLCFRKYILGCFFTVIDCNPLWTLYFTLWPSSCTHINVNVKFTHILPKTQMSFIMCSILLCLLFYSLLFLK
jgi:hypothetical protein